MKYASLAFAVLFSAAVVCQQPILLAAESEAKPAETQPAEPVNIDREIAKTRADLFNVQGETLEDRQAAFREKLAVALAKINEQLGSDLSAEDKVKLAKFKFDLLRYAVMVKVDGAKGDIEAYIEELKRSDQPALQEIAKREGLSYALDSYTSLSETEQRAIMEKALDLIHSQEPSSDLNIYALGVHRQIRNSKVPHETAKIHKQIAEHFAQSDDEKLQKVAAKFHAYARRLDLPGNAMELTGKKVDGTPFNVKELKGKVVLVDFWATWCGPCIAEFPNMRKLYEEHKEDGFEIVGVSVDDNHEHLTKYVELQEIPWIVLHEELEEGQRGWDHPAVKKYGIDAVPCMILIDRDGNVITTHARGEELEELMGTLFPVAPGTES